MSNIFKYYFRLAEHKLRDFLYAVVLTLLLFYLSDIYENSSFKLLLSSSKTMLPILTFLATLHSSSLIFFANSSSDIISKLKDEYIWMNHTRTNIKKIVEIYSYYSWAIVIQFSSLLYAIFLTFFLEPRIYNASMPLPPILLIVLSFLLIFLCLYSIILCLRNIGIFFLILIWKPNNEDMNTNMYSDDTDDDIEDIDEQ